MSQSSEQSPDSWIGTFCNLVGHEYFAEVSEDFIEDDFNLTGLQSQVPMYKDALEMILDVEPSDTNSSGLSEDEEEEEEEEDDGLLGDELDDPVANQNGGRQSGVSANRRRHGRTSSDTSVIESSAELLYGLIHARYITSRPGIQQMMEKYESSHFGFCPRVYCAQAKVLPVGLTDTPGQQTVKLYCPSCSDVYTPPNSRFQAVDGAFFGTTFPCLFFMTYPEVDVAPLKRRFARDFNMQTNEDAENVQSPTDAYIARATPGMTASRSSSLTLPPPPGTAGLPHNKDDKSSSSATAIPPLPPQPLQINGIASHNLVPGLGKGRIYEPRIYGFKVSERAKSGPRMRWLRSKPTDINELDEARIYHETYGGTVDGDPDDEPQAMSGEEEDEGEVEAEEDGDAIMGSQSYSGTKTGVKLDPDKDGDAPMGNLGPSSSKARPKRKSSTSKQQAGVEIPQETPKWI